MPLMLCECVDSIMSVEKFHNFIYEWVDIGYMSELCYVFK